MLLHLSQPSAKAALRYRVRPSFSLSLNEKDLELLEALQTYFGCGWIRESKSDRTFKFECRSVVDLVDLVVPHFECYPLCGSKARSFERFARVCRMIEQGDHLQRSGLIKIVGIASELNSGGAGTIRRPS